jgi:hypothetical protein
MRVPGPELGIIECVRIYATLFSKTKGDIILGKGCPSFCSTEFFPKPRELPLMNMKGLMTKSLFKFRIV